MVYAKWVFIIAFWLLVGAFFHYTLPSLKRFMPERFQPGRHTEKVPPIS